MVRINAAHAVGLHQLAPLGPAPPSYDDSTLFGSTETPPLGPLWLGGAVLEQYRVELARR